MMINDKSSFFERKAPNMISIVVSVVIFGKSMLINSITSTRNLSSYHRARGINMNHAVFILIYTCMILMMICSLFPALRVQLILCLFCVFFQVFSSYLAFCGIGLRNAQLYQRSQLENKRSQVSLSGITK